MTEQIYTLVGGPYRVSVRGEKSAKFYQAYRLPGDTKLYRAPCCKDLAKSRNRCWVEAHIKANKAKTDPLAQHEHCTLEQHLAVYLESLRVAGRCTGYINHTRDRITRVNDCLKWKRAEQVDGLKLKAWLAKMHQEGQVIQRKNSKAKRKFTMSERTMGYYWTAYRMFLVFLVRNHRIATNPLPDFWKAKGDVPVAFTRRAMTDAEFQALITAAANGKVSYGIPGQDRAMLYLAGMYSGLRAHELSSLTPRSFDLDGERPVILLDRAVSKRRRYDVLQLPEAVAEQFRQWLAGKDPEAKLWPGGWYRVARRMLRRDCKAAAVEMETDEGRLDFHCTRVSFITRLAGTDAPIALVLKLARLSDVKLLTQRYHRPHQDAATAAIESLPTAPAIPTL
jgi:integrase